MKVGSVGEMRAMDRQAIEGLGIPEAILMENAGRAAFEILSREWGVAGRRYLLFCGAGNNGGDGLVVARLILSGGGTPASSSLETARSSGERQRPILPSSRSSRWRCHRFRMLKPSGRRSSTRTGSSTPFSGQVSTATSTVSAGR